MNTSVTVAVAAIADAFDASIATVAAVVVLMNVAMAFTMPMAGAASAWLGPRRLIVGAGALVLAASLLLSFAPSLELLAVARLAQGIGLAAVVPISVQAVGALLHGDEHARALGWWGAANGVGLAFAPLIGGALVELAGWRWVTVPSCVLGVGLVVTSIRAFPRGFRPEHGIPLRGVGVVSLATGTAMTTLAAMAAGAWALALPAAMACLATMVAAARLGRAGGPLAAPRRWLHDRTVRRSSLGATLQMVANGLVQVAVPAWLILEWHLNAGAAAAILMGMTLTMAAMGPITGRRGTVPYETRLWRGLAGCAVGLVGLGIAALAGPWTVALPSLVVLGLGAGWLLSPSLTAFSRSVAGDNAVGLSIFNVARLGSFGIGGLVAGAALDVGMPAAAFLAVAAICGVAATWVVADRHAPVEATRTEGTAAPTGAEWDAAPTGAEGGSDDG